MEYLTESEIEDAFDLGRREGREEGVEEANRQFTENLLKHTELPPGKIAGIIGIPLEKVRNIHVMTLIQELVEKYRAKNLSEDRLLDYRISVNKLAVRLQSESYKSGVQDGIQLAFDRLIELFDQYGISEKIKFD